MAVGGAILRTVATLIRALQFCCAAIILGIFSYFLAVLAEHSLYIPRWEQAVEGMSGAAVLYTIFAILLTCFLGGKMFFAFLAIILDICFIGCFIAIAILTRGGANRCRGNVSTPVGTGNADTNKSGSAANYGIGNNNGPKPYIPRLKTNCKLETACFAVAIIGAFLFLISALLQLWLGRHHQKEKRYGPGPSNNYTSGSAKKAPFWKRKNNAKHDTELGAVGAVGAGALAADHHDHKNGIRPSHDTAVTGSTMANSPDVGYGGPANKYATEPMSTNHHAPLVGNAYTTDKNYKEQPTKVGVPHATQGHNHSHIGGDHVYTSVNDNGVEHAAAVHNNGYPHIEPTGQPIELGQTYGRTNY